MPVNPSIEKKSAKSSKKEDSQQKNCDDKHKVNTKGRVEMSRNAFYDNIENCFVCHILSY